MANPFEELVNPPQPAGPGPAPQTQASAGNPFAEITDSGGSAPSTARSYLGASARAAGQGLVSAAAGVAAGTLEGPGGVWLTPKNDLMTLYRNDPAAFDRMWNSPLYAAHRLEEEFANRATATMGNLTEQGKATAQQSYLPWGDKPYVGPSRVAGDLLQSGVQTAGTALSVAAAARGNPRAMLGAGAVEGLAEGQQTRQQVRQELDGQPLAAWGSVRAYQDLVKAGWHPEMARRKLVEDLSRQAGNNVAILSGLTATLGEGFLSHLGQGSLLRRAFIGGSTEIPVEATQTAVQQVEGNLAAREAGDTKRSPFEGLDEAVAAGSTLGFLQGAGFNAALGRRTEKLLGVAQPPQGPSAFDIPPQWQPQVDAAAAKYGVPRELLASTFYNESRWDPKAFAPGDQAGTMNPATGRPYDGGGLGGWGENWARARGFDFMDPNASIDQTAAAMREHMDRYGGNPLLARLAYGWGAGNVDKWLANGGDPAKIPDGAKVWLPRTAFGLIDEKAARAAFDQVGLLLKPGLQFQFQGQAPGTSGAPADPAAPPPAPKPSTSRALSLLDEADTSMLADRALRVDRAEAGAAARRTERLERDNVQTLDKVRSIDEIIAPQPTAQPKLTADAINLINEIETGGITRLSPTMQQIAAANGVKIQIDAQPMDLVAALREVPARDFTPEQVAAASGDNSSKSNDELRQMLSAKGITPADGATRETLVDLANKISGAADPVGALSLLDTGLSPDRIATREDTDNPNNRGKRETKPVQFGPADTIGKPLREATIRPGDVVTAALPYEGASLGYMGATHDFVQQMVRRFAPTARVIMAHQSKGEALASQRSLGDGWYLINPTNVTRREAAGSRFNKTTELQAAYSLSHEVGHVIVDHEFFRGLNEAQVAAIETLPSTGYFEESFLASLPKDQQAILREYNGVKRGLLEDPRKGAKDFIQRWLSPWKVAHGFDQAKVPEEGWARYANRVAGQNGSRMTARDFSRVLEVFHPNILGVHEYLAEQFSRYAYKKSLVEQTELGKTSWFQQTLAQLREFFKASRLNRIIGPSLKFEQWLEQLPDTAPQARKRARREAVSIEDLNADEGSTRFDTDEDVSLRDQILNNDRLGGVKPLPENLHFTVDEKTPGILTVSIREKTGGIQYYMDVQAGNNPEPSKEGLSGWTTVGTQLLNQGHILNTANVTRKYSGLGPALYERAAAEAEKRGFTLKSGATTSSFAERIWNQRVDSKQAVRTDQGWETIPDRVREEALELLAHGQNETAKETIERSIGKPVITRWDGSLPGMDEADSAMAQVDKLPPARSATRTFLATGLRRFIELQHAFLDVRQMAASNPHILGLRLISQSLTNIQAYRGTLETQSMGVQQRWAKLPKQQNNALMAFMEQEYSKGLHTAPLRIEDGHLRFTKDETFIRQAMAAGLEEDTAQLFLDIKNEYLHRLKLLQKFMRDRMLQAREDNPDRAAYWNARMQRLAEAFETIRSVPFHPQTRFGQYGLEVRRGNESQPFHYESFESAAARDAASEKIRKHSATNRLGLNVRDSYHDSHTAVMRVLPLQLMDSIGLGGTLTPSQRRQLFSSLDLITRDAKLRKYSPTLGAVTGASKDHMRVFADFMHNDALLLSKLAFRQDFSDGLAAIRDVREEASRNGDLATGSEMESILKFASKAVRQILNPAQEFHAIRSMVVMHDLWGNIKSAVANLTGLVNVWASVTKRLGTIQGSGNLASAAGRVAAERMGVLMAKVLRAPTEGWSRVYNENERWAMERASREGLIDETAAAQLAGWANSSNLERAGMSKGKRLIDSVMRKGMIPLKIVEQYTRRVALLSMFDAYVSQGLSRDAAYTVAVQDMFLTQGDNSILNRAEIMRGKKGVVLIYYNYMRNMTYLMGGGAAKARRGLEARGEVPASKGLANETARLWFAYFMLGGIMGLPGAEDADRLVELAAKMLGYRVSLRELAYELAREVADEAADLGIPIEARSIVHGFTSAIPLPGGGAVDISSSVGLGNAVPGLGGADKLGGRDEAKFLTGLLGPLGRRINEGMDLFQTDLPPEKRYALAIPASVQSIIKGLQDEPRFYSGGRILVDPRTGQVKELSTGEVLAQMMGFAPADISARQELHYMQKEFAEYWTSRRNGLLGQVWEARLSKNQDAIHDTMEAVKAFNEQVPASGLRITGDTIARSFDRRRAVAQRDERGQPPTAALREGYRQIQGTVLGR